MANLTITVDEATLKRARIRAIERGESVNQFLAEQLARYVDSSDDAESRQRAMSARLDELAELFPGSSDGKRWTREELYAERLDRYPRR